MFAATVIASAVFFTNSAARVKFPASTASVMPGKVVGAYPACYVSHGCPRAINARRQKGASKVRTCIQTRGEDKVLVEGAVGQSTL